MTLSDDERDALVQAIWNEHLDYTCICGFPHPKPGRLGPPPEVIERDGVWYQLPPYPGVMGDNHPIDEVAQ